MIKNITLFLIATFLVALISEMLLRIIGYNYSPLRIEVMNENLKKSDWREFHAFQDDYFVYSPELIWKPKKNYSVFNAQGYRGDELGEKKNNEFRIFAIGDSNTLGWVGELDAPNWPMYLENLLKESDDRFSVINAGVYGYTSFQGLRRFQEALKFQPDMVLISFGGNDAHRVVYSDREYIEKRQKIELYRILSKIRLGGVLMAAYDKLVLTQAYKKDFFVPRVDIVEYRNNLKEIIKIANDYKVQCVLLTRPFIGESPDNLWWKNFAPDYNRITIEVAGSNGIPAIDVYGYFKDKELHFADESHFNGLGHKIASVLIYENIVSLLPAHVKKIQVSNYLEELYNNFNKTRFLIPREIESNLINFYGDMIWTNGDGKITEIKYDIQPEDTFLVLKTFGWNPYRNNIEKLKLKIITNGIHLAFSHNKNDSYYFNLDRELHQINEIQIISSSFVPEDLGINDDSRKLGIDVASIEIK
jgi:lysophospholipase L1-like esterase